MKTQLRLVNAFRLIIGLMVILGAVGIGNMVRLSTFTEKLYRHPYTVSTAALRIESHISQMRIAMQELALDQSGDGLAGVVKRLDGLEAVIYADLEIVNERFLGDKDRVRQTRVLFAEWKTVRDGIIAAKRAGNEAAVREQVLRGAGAERFAAVLSNLHDFTEFASNKADSFIAQALETRDRTVWLSLVIMAACVLLGWVSARVISRPLSQMITVLSSTATEMAATVNQQERIAAQQAASVNETNTTMDELGASARQSAEQADAAAQGAQNAMELARDGVDRVEATLGSMSGAKARVEAIARQILLLSEQTGQIRQITDLVSGFANETKMLAMNAAVEAVRAGEHGKGFSVLAVETRKLADESKRSAGRINELVAEIQKATNATVMATEEGGKTVDEGMAIARETARAFQGVTETTQSAFEGAQQISMNVRQQSVAVKQVVEAMRAINTGTKESASGISQVKIGIQSLNEAARTLKEMI